MAGWDEKQLLDFAQTFNFLPLSHSRTIAHIAKRLHIKNSLAKRFLWWLRTAEKGSLVSVLDIGRLPVLSFVVLLKTNNPANRTRVFRNLSKARFVDRVLELNDSEFSYLAIFRIPSFDVPKTDELDLALHLVSEFVAEKSVILCPRIFFANRFLVSVNKAKIRKLDDKDWLLLSNLSKNSALSLEALGEKLGLNKLNVYRRLERFKRINLIEGVGIKISYTLLEEQSRPLSVVFLAKPLPGSEKSIIETLTRQYYEKLDFLYSGYFEYPLIFLLNFKNIAEAKHFSSDSEIVLALEKLKSFVVLDESEGNWLQDFSFFVGHTKRK